MRRMDRIPLPALAAASLVLVTTALALVFFVAPTDADQGFSQRIFYFHVSIAFTAYVCFGWRRLEGARPSLEARPERRPRELRRHPPGRHLRLPRPDDRLDLGEDLLGSLVAVEREPARAVPRSLPFLCAYFMLRFSLDAGPQRANICAVYALFGVVLIPVSFLAIRLATAVHPSGRLHAPRAELRRLDPR